MGVYLGVAWAWIVGQGHRSKVKVKCSKSCFDITVRCLVPCFEVKVKGQSLVSRAKVKVKCLEILGARLAECSNYCHYWSEGFVFLSVIRGHVRIIGCGWLAIKYFIFILFRHLWSWGSSWFLRKMKKCSRIGWKKLVELMLIREGTVMTVWKSGQRHSFNNKT